MTITKKELEFELIFLQELGLTPEELEGYLDFYEESFQIERTEDKTTYIKEPYKCDANIFIR